MNNELIEQKIERQSTFEKHSKNNSIDVSFSLVTG